MEQKLKNQIAWLKSMEKDESFDGDFHTLLVQIIENRKYFQHERLIHLLVTLGVGMVLLFVFYLFISRAEMLFGILLLIVLILEGAYLLHYFRLENGVQKLWEIEQRLLAKYK
jgi:hypothetical protein